MDAIDKKYQFLAVNTNGKVLTEKDGIVFKATDDALPATLRFYREECIRLGAKENHIRAVDCLIMRVEKFRETNPEKCKVADEDSADNVSARYSEPRRISKTEDDNRM